MNQRLHPAVSAVMLAGIENEKEITALVDLAIDQSLPTDIRRHAGEKLNDLEKDTLIKL